MWAHSQFNKLERTGWVSLSLPSCHPACYECWWCLVLTLKTSVIRYIMHSLSHSELCPCLYLCQPLEKNQPRHLLGRNNSRESSPSSTQIISRKNPEDVQEVRRAAISFYILSLCVCKAKGKQLSLVKYFGRNFNFSGQKSCWKELDPTPGKLLHSSFAHINFNLSYIPRSLSLFSEYFSHSGCCCPRIKY